MNDSVDYWPPTKVEAARSGISPYSTRTYELTFTNPGEDPWLCDPGFRRVCLYRDGRRDQDCRTVPDMRRQDSQLTMAPGDQAVAANVDPARRIAAPPGGRRPVVPCRFFMQIPFSDPGFDTESLR
jgi:hypothetical protein